MGLLSKLSPEKQEADVITQSNSLYPHRLNRDGSFDSICLICFMTVSTSKIESELDKSDANHICESSFLAERGMNIYPRHA